MDILKKSYLKTRRYNRWSEEKDGIDVVCVQFRQYDNATIYVFSNNTRCSCNESTAYNMQCTHELVSEQCFILNVRTEHTMVGSAEVCPRDDAWAISTDWHIVDTTVEITYTHITQTASANSLSRTPIASRGQDSRVLSATCAPPGHSGSYAVAYIP